MRQGFDRTVIVGIIVLAAVMVGIAATASVNTRKLRDGAARADRSQQVVEVVGIIRADARKLQAAQRAFLISGVEGRLVAYHEAAADLRAEAARLKGMTEDDRIQWRRAEDVAAQIEEGIAGLEEVIALRRAKGLDAVEARARNSGGRSFVDPLLETLAQMEGAERERLATREAEARTAYDRSVFYEVAAAVIGLLAVAVFALLLRHSDRTRARLLREVETERRRLAEVFQHAPSFMCVLRGPDHVFERANNRYFELLGRSDIIGKPVREAVPEVTGQGFFEILDQVYRTGEPFVGTGIHITLQRGGQLEERILEFVYQPIRDAAGSVSGILAHGIDLTDRKTAEAGLLRSEERYRLLVNATADVVYRMSPDWSVMQPLDGRGLVPSSAEPESNWLHLNLPQFEHARVKDAIDRAIRDKQTFELEHQVKRADGTLGWTFSRAVPILDASGQIVEWFGTARDVTLQRQAREELARVTAESERQRRMFDTALSNTADFVYLFDLEGRFTYVNKALLDLWRKDSSQAVGRTFSELDYPPDLAVRLQNQIQEVVRTRQPLRDETLYTSALGTRAYEYIFVPVIGENGAVEAVAGSTRDITERKESEEALKDSDRKKDDFIALLAHELRNPLAPIRNGLQVIGLASANPKALAQARAMMDRQLGHMVRLIDDLLDVSRIGRNKMELRRARVLFSDVVASAVETARPLIDAEEHQLTIALPPEPIYLDADLTRLAQVFSNLLSNSAKYTKRGGRIWLSAERRGERVVVVVRDTGIGIPADALGRIFDMFSQVDRSIERATGGLGIGLALVKGLVEMHGGTVTAASGGQDQGSSFTVTLPVLLTPAEAAEAPSGHTQTAPARGRRILVVDDNRDGGESMAMMLRLLNNDVRTAHDGLEAITQAEAFRPDMILMDVGMPRMNGLDATRHIRQQSWGQSVKIIALTGWGQNGDKEQSRAAGCDGHLVKPVDPVDLARLLTD